jgi:putative DNA primase/helicase
MTDEQTITKAIPQELRDLNQWVVWQRNEAGNKIPLQINGEFARVNDPETWDSFKNAMIVAHDFDGIGFVITADDPYCGIDLDNCLDERGSLREWALPITAKVLNVSYGEISPSGKGIKFLTRAEKLKGSGNVMKFGDKKQQLECYDGRNRKTGIAGHRWWAITGDVYHTSDEIGCGQEAIDWICSEYLMANSGGLRLTLPAHTDSIHQSTIYERAISYVAKLEPSVSGERGHDRLFRAACVLVIGFDLGAESSMRILREHFNPRCEPIWSERELRHKVEDAMQQPEPRGLLINSKHKRNDSFDRMIDRVVQCSNEQVTYSDGEWIGDPQKQNHNELARRFVNAFGDDLRFIRQWKTWCVWDGSRWLKDESGRDSLRLARDFAKELWGCIGDFAKTIPERDEIAKALTFVKSMNQLAHMESTLKMASADSEVLVNHDELNQDPFLFNVANGTIDLKTGEHRPHRQSDLITLISPARYEPSAVCPDWLKFLDLIFNGDSELIRYVQQLLGYALIGSNDAHILPIAVGGGCNGKSTLSSVMQHLLGEYATTAMESLALGSKNEHACEVADLYCRRFVAINEPECGDRLRESRVKMLTGDSKVKARGMRENPWEFDRTFLLWMSTNHKPRILGNDEAIWRRIKVIPFTVDIRTKTSPIPDFDRTLVEAEGSGILNWLIAGCLDYQKHGFIEPECVTMAVNEYRCEEDQIGAFLEECCVTNQPGYEVTANRLYDCYYSWAGREALTKTKFGREIGKLFTKNRPTSGSFRNQTIYSGIALAETDPSDNDYRH